MSKIRAVVVDPAAPNRLGTAYVDPPVPAASQAVVQVVASSLNRGDLLAAQASDAGWRPGHDLAGTVVRSAADGTGPAVGDRVVGLLDSAAWCEQVAIATDRLAVLPEEVGFESASTLPTAGVTAYRALSKGGQVLGRRVLITGSTGGVGMFVHQLASASGAVVVGTSRRPDTEQRVRELGADEVVVGDDLSAAAAFGPYDLIVESLGGRALAAVMPQLVAGGTCVAFGWSSDPTVELELPRLLAAGGRTLYGLRLPFELTQRPASDDLAILAELLADGRLDVRIGATGSWDDLGSLAGDLLDRRLTGKAVFVL